jgi:hypothetical protein
VFRLQPAGGNQLVDALTAHAQLRRSLTTSSQSWPQGRAPGMSQLTFTVLKIWDR